MLKADLPNDWNYELAEQFLKGFVQKTFVDKGMCADIAIHDSVNPEDRGTKAACGGLCG